MRGSPPWLGINDIHTEGNWVWSDGSPANFENWQTGEPNNNGDQDCGQMYSGRWDDDKCQVLKSFICKNERPNHCIKKIYIVYWPI